MMTEPFHYKIGNYLFLLTLLVMTIGPLPFAAKDLIHPVDTGSNVNVTYNLMFLFLFFSTSLLVMYRYRFTIFEFIHPFIYFQFIWIFICFYYGQILFIPLKKIILMLISFCIFSCLPLIPSNQKIMAKMATIYSLLILIICYVGVIIFPEFAIHQAGDATEQALAGDWRGLFIHKNTAGFSISILFFIGFYVYSNNYKIYGLIIIFLSLIFIVFTKSKTSIIIIFPVILVSYIVLLFNNKITKLIIILFFPFLLYFLTIGSLFNSDINDFLLYVGIDTSFTGRKSIWEFVISKISLQPIYGNGFNLFWDLPEVKFNQDAFSWVSTIGSAHNSILEIALSGGIPMIGFFLLFGLIFPIMSYFKALILNGPSPLITLFLQVWIYILCTSTMESIFYTSSIGWGFFTFAVMGLFYLGNFHLKRHVK